MLNLPARNPCSHTSSPRPPPLPPPRSCPLALYQMKPEVTEAAIAMNGQAGGAEAAQGLQVVANACINR